MDATSGRALLVRRKGTLPLARLLLLPRPMETRDQAASSCASSMPNAATWFSSALKTISCCSAASRSLLSTVMLLLLLLEELGCVVVRVGGRQVSDSGGVLPVLSDKSVWPG